MAKKNYSGIQKWMLSKSGQTFLNYAYSWGASVVIAGALFKLTHISGADIMLFLGMGTEVLVFILAGFEPQEAVIEPDSKTNTNGGGTISEETAAALANAAANAGSSYDQPAIIINGGVPANGGGTTVIGGGIPGMPEETEPATSQTITDIQAHPTAPTQIFNPALFNGMTPEMQESTDAYVEQLKQLTETLKQVAEQSARLTRDSEEMETMNRTLTGINRFYEMQLKSVGTQSATIDEVNDQTKRLAEQLQGLNEVYAKMVEALKMKIS